MNCAAVEWALAQNVRPSSVKFVLVAIAGRTIDGVLQASQAELAHIVGLTDRSVRAALKALEAEGYIERKSNPGKGKGRLADTIHWRQPETGQPENSSAGKDRQPEKSASGKNRGNRKPVPHQPEKSSGEQPETVSARAVDNSDAHIKHAHTRAEPPSNITTTLEDYPETVELAEAVVVAREVKLNGSASRMSAHELAAIIVDSVNSPWLDPHKSCDLNTTETRIKAWMSAGADFDADILPTIRTVMARPRSAPVTLWGYFDKPVRAATAKRMKAEAPMPPITEEEANAHVQQHTSRASDEQPRIRREPVSPTTAARMRRRAEREARNQPLDLGRLDSERLA